MALFQYRAYSESGKVIRGIIDADSFDAAKDRLRTMQLPVIDVKPLHRTTENLKLSSEALLAFTRDLSQLLQAGLPLYESLVTIEEKFRGRKDHRVFLELCDQLKNGASLSKALQRFPLVFDAVSFFSFDSVVRSKREAAQDLNFCCSLPHLSRNFLSGTHIRTSFICCSNDGRTI